MREKMTAEQRMFIRRLSAANFADVIYVEDDLVTGGNIGDEQVDVATAMIALGGGKGSLTAHARCVKRSFLSSRLTFDSVVSATMAKERLLSTRPSSRSP